MSIVTVSVFSVAAICIGLYAAKRFHGSPTETLIYVLIYAAIAICCIIKWGYSMLAIRYLIFALIAEYCSYSDLKTQKVDDYPHLMICINALIGANIAELPMLVGTMLVCSGLMLAAILFRVQINGADFKYIAACSFLMGYEKITIGLLLGLTLAIVVNLIKRKHDGFPLIPYITAGFLATILIY